MTSLLFLPVCLLALTQFNVISADWLTDERTGKQYLVLDTEDVVHDDNQQVCHNHGGFLPEPRDERENNFLHDLGTDMFALGMTDRATEGLWVWDSDGTPVVWTSWITGWRHTGSEPNGNRAENCVVMAKKQWSQRAGHRPDGWVDVPCTYRYRSSPTSLVCQRNPDAWVTDTKTGKKYIVLETTTMDNNINQQTCKNIGGHLPEPRNEQDNLFLNSLGSEMFCLGINDEESEGRWVFASDGSPVTWFSWVNFRDHPDAPNGGRTANCAFMRRNLESFVAGHRDQDWGDTSCSSTNFLQSKPKSLICEQQACATGTWAYKMPDPQNKCKYYQCDGVSVVGTRTDCSSGLKFKNKTVGCMPLDDGETCGPITGCPSGFENIDGLCFAKRTEKVTQAEASASCQQMGGFLAEPRSEATTTAMKQIRFETNHPWIGLKDTAKTRNFLWQTDNTTLSYKNWDRRQPNNLQKIQHCVALNPNKKWDDIDCELKHEYLCQAHTTVQCPGGWTQKDNSCYMRFKKKNYEKATKLCEENGAHLIGPSYDRDFLMKELGLRDKQSAWLFKENIKCTHVELGKNKVHDNCGSGHQIVCVKKLNP